NQSAFNQLGLSLFTQHRFAEAQVIAAKQAALYPDNAQAWLLYSETALERGDYEVAQRALEKQPDAAKSPSVQAVQARLLDINGHPQPALKMLQQAQAEADVNPDMPRENVAWFHMRVGDELARMGRIDDAQHSYQEALALFPRDYKTLTGLTRLAAGRQDWPATISWGKKAMAIVPAPEAVVLVGDAYAAQGNTKDAEDQYRLIEAMGTLARAQRQVYDRYRSRFDSDHGRHLGEALALAQSELKVRQDIYAYDTLAWAYYKNGMFAQGGAAMKKALAHNTQDSLLFYHAGRIAAAQGDQAQAQADLAHAAALDPFFHPDAPVVTQHPYGGF
ncbi:MAG: tetratricopeptide repeat protein, partial [Armatimonadota bacterium]|nr:tetratricopeptide repeat protein [Armatimonadota bacterium]